MFGAGLCEVALPKIEDFVVTTRRRANVVGEQRYYPYGETRLVTGSMLTDKLFTGQREMAGLGIYHYGARFYSPTLGRFISADSIVPGASNPQAFNRYSYVLNNPLKYTDPTGHGQCRTREECEDMGTTPYNGNGRGGGKKGGGGRDEAPTTTPTYTPTTTPTTAPTTTPTYTPTVSPTNCPIPNRVCVPTATNTPSPMPTVTPYNGPSIGAPVNSSPPWEFPYTIGVKDPFDFGIDIAGIIGDGASVLGVQGKVVWVLTEGAEVVGLGRDVYALALKKDASGISDTYFFYSAEKLAPDLIRMKNPGIISFAGNIWSISQNITITPK